MKILITGSNGFIASQIAYTLLCETTHEIIATSRSSDKNNFALFNSRYSYHSLDISDRDHILMIKNLQPDIIIHAAAMGSADECELNPSKALTVNYDATKYIIKEANAIGAKLIFLSTDFVFDGEKGSPYAEEDVPNPINHYGLTKFNAEEYIRKNCMNYCIIRLCAVYGNGLTGKSRGIITLTKDRLSSKQQIQVVNDQYRTPTFVADIGKGIVGIINYNISGIINISGEEIYTPYEMAITAATYFGLDEGLIVPVNSDYLNEPARRPLSTGFIVNKAKAAFDFKPTSLIDGIKKMVE